MKPFSKSRRTAALIFLSACLWSCISDGPSGEVEISMRIGAVNVIDTRALGNDDPLSVDHIVVVPYIKSNSAAEDPANYRASTELAVRMDVDQFPVNDLTMMLSPMSTCRLVVLGFNRTNTDDLTFDYGTSLANLSVEDRAAANNSPSAAELFWDMSDPFVPGGGTTVSATLVRMVGGLSITLTDVPDGVELRLYHNTPLITRWMVTGATADGTFDTQENYYTMTAQGGGESYYARYYFPTDAAAPLSMDIEAMDTSASPESRVARVRVATSDGNQFTIVGNRAINLSGDYRQVILGQELFETNPDDQNIHLDDDNWDGVDDTPESDPAGT